MMGGPLREIRSHSDVPVIITTGIVPTKSISIVVLESVAGRYNRKA